MILGKGINDADYIVCPTVNGKQMMCPFYSKWREMLVRCYSQKSRALIISYSDCYVCDEWLEFSSFRNWMEGQEWKGKDLDKDILTIGNNVYSPETCVFVSHSINLLLTNRRAARGAYKQGCCFRKDIKLFSSSMSVNGKTKHLGLFKTEIEAADAYNNAKAKHIRRIANKQDEPIRSGLLRYSDYYAMKSFYENNEINNAR